MSSSKTIPDHYETLGVSRDASPAEIRTARNRLLRQYHPDMHPDDPVGNKDKTVAILLAAKVLMDDEARREYDRHYDYVHGRLRVRAEPEDEGRTRTVCDTCGRPSQWRRSYCIYCGAVGKTPTTRANPDAEAAARSTNSASVGIPFDFLREEPGPPRSWPEKGIHLGCGMVLGLACALGFGWRLVGAAGFESGYAVAILTATWVVGIGILAMKVGDRFWTRIHITFFTIIFLAVGFVPVSLYVRRFTGDDGKTLLALFSILLVCGAGIALAAKKWPTAFTRLWRTPD